MNRQERRMRAKGFKKQERAILGVLSQWDVIRGAPRDEFDCLAHHVIGALQQGASVVDLEAVIAHELTQHIGMKIAAEEVRRVAETLVGQSRTTR